jgi:hypothetical protein
VNNENEYKGSCFCGAVQFTVGGEPAAMGYCHCESCRRGLPKLKDPPMGMGGSGLGITE